MKKLILIYVFFPILIFAQKVDRSQSPTPLPAKAIQINNPEVFELKNGLKVFVVQNKKLPIVNVNLVIDRLPIKENEKAGLADLAGSLLIRGTEQLSKEQLDEEIDFLGADLNTDATSIFGSCLKNNFPKLFALMSQVALQPALDKNELEIIRKQTISSLQSNKESATAIAENVKSVLLYGKEHPFGEIETIESVKKVTIDDIKTYYKAYWKPNIAYLVFVGDITFSEAKELAEKYFSKWEKGEIIKTVYPKVNYTEKPFIALVDRPQSVQSSIRVFKPIDLPFNSNLYIPTRVLNNILGGGSEGRLFKNLREKHGFTYGAYSKIEADRIIGNIEISTEVRNEKTDSAIYEILEELNLITTQLVKNEELIQSKNEIIGSFARAFENPATIARLALNIDRYNLPKDFYKNYLTNITNVNEEQILNTAKQLINVNNVVILVVGKVSEIAKKLQNIAELKYFDIYGNAIPAPKEKLQIPGGITAKDILNNYIHAVFPKGIEAIKDFETTGNGILQDNPITIIQKYITPNNFINKFLMAENIISSQSLINDKYSMKTGLTEVTINDDIKFAINEAATIVPELYFLSNSYQLKIIGSDIVDNQDVYVVEIKSPSNTVYTNYYNANSKLKVREVKTDKNSTTTNDMKDYKLIDGLINFPTTQKYQFNKNVTFTIEFKKLNLNKGLTIQDLN